MVTDPFLTVKENRAIHRLMEQACQDEACGDAGCADIRTTVGAVKRLLARLAIVRRALNGEEGTQTFGEKPSSA